MADFLQFESHPSPSSKFPSSHCYSTVVIPSPQIGMHLKSDHEYPLMHEHLVVSPVYCPYSIKLQSTMQVKLEILKTNGWIH